MAGLVQACPGHLDNRAPCHPDRDRRDKPGDDATSFAPVTPDVHNKVKNQRIWLMLLSLDLFKYFSDKK